MNARNVVTLVLVMFVAVSVAVLIGKEIGKGPTDGGGNAAAGQVEPASSTAAQVALPDKPSKAQVLVYYFHRTQRCSTCRNMETYAHEAVTTRFAKELADGRIEWRVLNYEEPQNAGLRREYDLGGPMLVLVRTDGKGSPPFKTLDEIWSLAFDKPGFLAYVEAELKGFLKELSGGAK
jgi:hypothetical protein